MCWRLLIEEYGPELCYIPGAHTIVADALSCLDLHPLSTSNTLHELLTLEDKLALPPSAFPLRYATLAKAQSLDPALMVQLKKGTSEASLQSFHGGDQHHELVCKNGNF